MKKVIMSSALIVGLCASQLTQAYIPEDVVAPGGPRARHSESTVTFESSETQSALSKLQLAHEARKIAARDYEKLRAAYHKVHQSFPHASATKLLQTVVDEHAAIFLQAKKKENEAIIAIYNVLGKIIVTENREFTVYGRKDVSF
jgi:hypothetical protein